jgi:hypothetical protein
MDESIVQLQHRVQLLEDEQQLRALLSKYGFTADLGLGDEYIDLFTDDAVMDIGARQPPGRFQGKGLIRRLFFDGATRSSISGYSQHHAISGPIVFQIDHETRRIRVGHTVHPAIHLAGANLNRWTFRRVDGRWRIAGRKNRETGTEEAARLFVSTFA